MQSWMIVLIVVAGVVALLAAAFLVWALVPVHIVLGKRKAMTHEQKLKKGYSSEKFGVDSAWFTAVESCTEKLSITAYDGVKLSAMLIRQPEHAGRVAMCCHGYGATQFSMQVQAKLFYDRGFDVVLPAMRGHEGSGGKVGMAWVDRFDLLRWVDKAIDIFGKDVSVALCGVSMGGATVIAACGMPLPSQVKCVIDDCGFNSQYDEYAACLAGGRARENISAFHRLSLWMLNVGVKLVHGYSLYDANIEGLAKNMSIPALFIHGDADGFVPYALGQRLYEACASEHKEFVTVENAAHAMAYVTDPQKYTEAFTAFVDKYVQGSAFLFDSGELPVVEDDNDPETAAPDEENSNGADAPNDADAPSDADDASQENETNENK